MALNEEQLKAAKSLERALNKCGKVGLSGGVYDSSFILFDENESREEVVESLFLNGEDERGVSLLTPEISLDGGAGV